MADYPTTRLDRAVDKAIRDENANPQGLPADVLAGMEADIRANPDRYPAITAALAQIDSERAPVTAPTFELTADQINQLVIAGRNGWAMTSAAQDGTDLRIGFRPHDERQAAPIEVSIARNGNVTRV